LNYKIEKNKSLKGLTTFNVDYSCSYFIEIYNCNLIYEILKKKDLLSYDLLFLGRGSNILFTKNFTGVVIKVLDFYKKKIFEDDYIVKYKISSSYIWDNFVCESVEENLYGLENLSLIPGTVGASVLQNIGAYGCEIKDFVESVFCLDLKTGLEFSLEKKKCSFDYRDSIFRKNKNFFIKEVTFVLSKQKVYNFSYEILKKKIANVNIISNKEIRDIVIEMRKSKIPDYNLFPNAGSFFKNLEVSFKEFFKLKIKFVDIPFFLTKKNKIKISTGWLIENSLDEKIDNDKVFLAQKNSLIIIKDQKANGIDVLNFSKLIKKQVYNKFFLNLEEEVEIL
jgi:UDP-N-acetylmuramate dehydrogenase